VKIFKVKSTWLRKPSRSRGCCGRCATAAGRRGTAHRM